MTISGMKSSRGEGLVCLGTGGKRVMETGRFDIELRPKNSKDEMLARTLQAKGISPPGPEAGKRAGFLRN